MQLEGRASSEGNCDFSLRSLSVSAYAVSKVNDIGNNGNGGSNFDDIRKNLSPVPMRRRSHTNTSVPTSFQHRRAPGLQQQDDPPADDAQSYISDTEYVEAVRAAALRNRNRTRALPLTFRARRSPARTSRRDTVRVKRTRTSRSPMQRATCAARTERRFPRSVPTRKGRRCS